MTLRFDDLDLGALKRLQDRIAAAIAGFDTRAKAEAHTAAEAVARRHGFSLADLAGVKRARPDAGGGVPQYRNPQDPGSTWTGRGRRPDWFKAHVAAGGDPDHLRIR